MDFEQILKNNLIKILQERCRRPGDGLGFAAWQGPLFDSVKELVKKYNITNYTEFRDNVIRSLIESGYIELGNDMRIILTDLGYNEIN